MPITEALKKLIKTITGKNAVGETIEELVQNLNDNYPEGGGGDEYETVAEIAVGTMEYSEEIDAYVADGLTPSQTLPRSSNDLYFNNAAYPLTYYADEPAYVYNFDMATGTATGTPSYAVLFDGSTVNLISDTDAIKNTTVRILKKVGGETITVDSALSDTSENPVQNKVIASALNERPVDFIITADLDPETDEIVEASASLADVLAVAGAGRNIVFILHAAAESGGTTINLYDRFSECNIENYGGGNGVVVFSKVEKDNGTPLLCSIIAVSGDHDGKWVYDEVELATATP